MSTALYQPVYEDICGNSIISNDLTVNGKLKSNKTNGRVTKIEIKKIFILVFNGWCCATLIFRENT